MTARRRGGGPSGPGLLPSGLAALLAALLAACLPPAGRVETVPAGDGCLAGECHRSVLSSPHLHFPVKEGSCTACHRRKFPRHPENDGSEFSAVRSEGGVICFDCHREKSPAPPFVHAPYATGQCEECHEAHGSPIRPLMKRDVKGLCLYCHRDLAARLDRCDVTHGALLEEDCVTTCHDPHAEDRDSLLRKEEGGLCRECHPALETCEGREKACTSCHFPHASNDRMLLRRP